MKKLLFLILVVLFFSCQKEECYICTVKITTSTTHVGPYASQPPSTSTTTVTECGMTEKEADAYERKGSSTSTVNIGGVTGTSVSTCTCKIQP